MFISVLSASALLGCPATPWTPEILLGLEGETQVSWPPTTLPLGQQLPIPQGEPSEKDPEKRSLRAEGHTDLHRPLHWA